MAVRFKNFGIGALSVRHLLFKAVFSNNRRLATMSELLDKVPDVKIDDCGIFKYVLIEIRDKANNVSKFIVRGTLTNWHSNIVSATTKQLKSVGDLEVKCVGGGIIEHFPSDKVLRIHGHSKDFGRADHEVSTNLLKKKYSDYTIIEQAW